MQVIVIRYAEIALKGQNRRWFEKQLIKNLKTQIQPFVDFKIERQHQRLLIYCKDNVDLLTTALQYIPGIANYSRAEITSHDLASITNEAICLLKNYIQTQSVEKISFKIETRRSEKSYPMTSYEISAKIGAEVLQAIPEITVDVHQPELTVGIEIWQNNQAILYLNKQPGLGGLPIGSSGRLISFLSGGIDSPVASWFLLKRGCEIIYLTFYSYPFIGEESRQKVIDLVKHLSRYQPRSILLIAPFAKIQKEIKQNCKEKLRTILYRRTMLRIAEALSEKYRIQGYVTGEAVGQVASQTLDNMHCINSLANLPILRPLVGMEKSDIIYYAKKIKTFPISIQKAPDSCIVFQPRNPETHAKLNEVLIEESKIDLKNLVQEAVDNIDKLEFNSNFINPYPKIY